MKSTSSPLAQQSGPSWATLAPICSPSGAEAAGSSASIARDSAATTYIGLPTSTFRRGGYCTAGCWMRGCNRERDIQARTEGYGRGQGQAPAGVDPVSVHAPATDWYAVGCARLRTA